MRGRRDVTARAHEWAQDTRKELQRHPRLPGIAPRAPSDPDVRDSRVGLVEAELRRGRTAGMLAALLIAREYDSENCMARALGATVFVVSLSAGARPRSASSPSTRSLRRLAHPRIPNFLANVSGVERRWAKLFLRLRRESLLRTTPGASRDRRRCRRARPTAEQANDRLWLVRFARAPIRKRERSNLRLLQKTTHPYLWRSPLHPGTTRERRRSDAYLP